MKKHTKSECEKKIAKWQERLKNSSTELNRWYKGRTGCTRKLLIFVTEVNIDGYIYKGYGFNTNGEWSDCNGVFEWGLSSCRLATNEEIKSALVAEATKRGFKEGVTVDQKPAYPEYGEIRTIKHNEYSIDSEQENLCIGGVGIYMDGKWVKIIEPTIEKYTDLKTMEDVYKVLKLDIVMDQPFIGYPERHVKSTCSYADLVLIVEAANYLDNSKVIWVPDYNDVSELKFEPRFVMGSSGFRLRVYGHWDATSAVGSRLCFKSRDVMNYITDQFLDKYEAHYK